MSFKFKSRYIYTSIIVFAISIALVSFQNCSKTNFSASNINSDASTTILPSEGPPSMNLNEIQITGNTSNAGSPIKVFLIVDFSYSMVNELAKVRTALDNFLEQHKQWQAFDVYMYPIQNGFHGVENSPTAGTTSIVLDPPIAQMQLRNNRDYDIQKAQFLSSFNSKISQISQNGSQEVTETGLCQIVRIIKQSNLYSNTDRIAFITITDEDDGSSSPNNNDPYASGCLEKTTPETQVRRQINFESDIVAAYVVGEYSGIGPADGGGQAPFQKVNFRNGISCGDFPQFCAQVPSITPCTTAMKNEIKTNNSVNGWIINTIDSCNIEVSNIHNGGAFITDSEMRTLSNQPISQADWNRIVNQTQGFIYYQTSYTDINDFISKNYPTMKNVTFIASESNGQVLHQHPEFANPPSAENLNHAAVMNLINAKIPNAANLVMDFVIYNPALNPQGVTCGSGDAGVIGKNYSDFVTRSGRANFKKESICQSSYDSALSHAASLAVWSPNRSYTLTGPNAQNAVMIDKIKIVDAKNNVLARLVRGQYGLDVSTKVLTIPAPLELPQGSKIIFEF